MGWIGWVVVGIIVLAVIGHFIPDDPKKSRIQKKLAKKPERNVGREAEEIAEKVTTIQQFRALDRKLETATERYGESGSEAVAHKYEVLSAAYDIAQSKIYQWQFVPLDVDLHTPKRILETAYKVFSNEEYQELKGQLPDSWHELDAWGEPEELEENIKPLIRFRSIVESDNTKEEKIKKINRLVSRDAVLAEEFFDLYDEELKPGEQWFAGELA